MSTDFRFYDHGSLTILTPLTEQADEWIIAHIPESAAWFGGGVVIEPRFADAILTGINDDGLTIA